MQAIIAVYKEISRKCCLSFCQTCIDKPTSTFMLSFHMVSSKTTRNWKYMSSLPNIHWFTIWFMPSMFERFVIFDGIFPDCQRSTGTWRCRTSYHPRGSLWWWPVCQCWVTWSKPWLPPSLKLSQLSVTSNPNIPSSLHPDHHLYM